MMILDSCFFFLGWLPPPLGFYTAIWWSTSMMSIAKKNRNLYRVVIYVARQTNGFVQRGGILTLGCQGNPNFVSWFGRLPAKRLCVTRMHLFTKVFTHYPKTEHLWSCEWYGKKTCAIMCSQSCKVHVWLMKKHACGWGSRLLDHIFGYNIMLILDVPCFKNKQLYLAWLSKAQAFQLHDLAKKHQKQKRKGRSFTSPQTKRTKSAGSGILTNINLALLVQSCPQNLDAPWQLRTTLDNMDTLPQEVCFDSLDVPMSLSKTVAISFFCWAVQSRVQHILHTPRSQFLICPGHVLEPYRKTKTRMKNLRTFYGVCTLLLLHRYELSTSYHTVYLSSQPHQYTKCRNRT